MTGVGLEVRDTEGLWPSFKRQLSAPSNNETLQKVNDVCRYLQVMCVVGFVQPILLSECHSVIVSNFAFSYL